MKVELWEIEKVIPYASNPRINAAAVAQVAASITEFGFAQPIVVDAGGVVIAGHTRLLAARQLGLEKVPVFVAKHLTPAQAKAYRLVDNRSGETARWDLDLLAAELQQLDEMEWDIDSLGWDASAIEALTTAPTEPPDNLPPSDITGDDDRQGRFILVYACDAEKQRWQELLGIDGARVVYTLADLAR